MISITRGIRQSIRSSLWQSLIVQREQITVGAWPTVIDDEDDPERGSGQMCLRGQFSADPASIERLSEDFVRFRAEFKHAHGPFFLVRAPAVRV
ncbi:hypothetical protein Agabi119p4_7762 [Agaricus bisporus var. burnettii]|uniref:Uncharacterized protein n=1 Tax=Agaricus bisporus var. burnettii TaxID=192524 RepID=A0A8H7C7I8_AGABI|nr:hypothetical protein Agabi119p4_7762 [Agaricus bisporus var. burnettii]